HARLYKVRPPAAITFGMVGTIPTRLPSRTISTRRWTDLLSFPIHAIRHLRAAWQPVRRIRRARTRPELRRRQPRLPFENHVQILGVLQPQLFGNDRHRKNR